MGETQNSSLANLLFTVQSRYHLFGLAASRALGQRTAVRSAVSTMSLVQHGEIGEHLRCETALGRGRSRVHVAATVDVVIDLGRSESGDENGGRTVTTSVPCKTTLANIAPRRTPPGTIRRCRIVVPEPKPANWWRQFGLLFGEETLPSIEALTVAADTS